MCNGYDFDNRLYPDHRCRTDSNPDSGARSVPFLSLKLSQMNNQLFKFTKYTEFRLTQILRYIV